MEIRVARLRNVDHRRDVELAELLVDGIPRPVKQRQAGPHAAGRVRVQVDADEAELVYRSLHLRDRVGWRRGRRLRQLGDTDKVLGVEVADAVDDVVGELGPDQAHLLVADVVLHSALSLIHISEPTRQAEISYA